MNHLNYLRAVAKFSKLVFTLASITLSPIFKIAPPTIVGSIFTSRLILQLCLIESLSFNESISVLEKGLAQIS